MTTEELDILQVDKTIQYTLARSSPSYPTPDINISDSLRRKIQSTAPVDSQTKNFYLLDTMELIQEYKETLKTPIRINFMTNKPVETLKPNTPEKTSIIQTFMERIKPYEPDFVQASPSSQPIFEQCCMNCNSRSITESIEFEGVIICLDCGSQETTLNLANSIRINHNDSKRINICSKYSYDKKSHFLNCINQYQGRHKSGIDPEITQALIGELDKYNLIDHAKPTKSAQFRNVTKEHILLFVKELRLTKSYGDINLIHHLITDYPLNDISHLTEKLLQDFDLFVQMHYKLFPNDTERKNFNYQHLLYQLLVRHKYPCNPAEFNFLKTIDRKYYHDEICRTIFENLGWNYSSLF
jgi:hypothetical protein